MLEIFLNRISVARVYICITATFFVIKERMLTTFVSNRAANTILEYWLTPGNHKDTLLHQTCCVIPNAVTQLARLTRFTRDLRHEGSVRIGSLQTQRRRGLPMPYLSNVTE